MTPAELKLSAELSDELSLKPHEAANLVARYWALVEADYVTQDGDKLKHGEYDKERRAVNETLKKYIADVLDGEPMAIEGLPLLRLKNPGAKTVDLPALLEHEPDLFYAVLSCMKLDVSTALKMLNPEQASRLEKWVHTIGIGSRLEFERR